MVRVKTACILMWSCVALFAARVVAQFEALMLAPRWLPGMGAWDSGPLPYYLLLPAQIAILMFMSVVAWNRRIRNGSFARAHPRAAGALRILAGVYFTAMAVRLGVNVMENGAEYWRHGAMPVAFHWMLALFVLVAGRDSESAMRKVRMPAEQRDEDDEADDIPHGDVPALAQPLKYGLGVREQVGYGNAG